MTIRLVLADDHPLVLRGLEHLFAAEADCEVMARCGNGKEVLEAVRRHEPDVVILDSRMPATDSLEIIRAVARDPAAPRVVLHAERGE
ncbi:MAG TPA: response regulator transcription factor [Methylomirabilota bacterium]